MPKSSLSTLLPELLHMVLDEIQTRGDLLSLALTCSTFKALVIPNRLDYHTISTSVYYPALWNHLISRPDLVRNVRELILCDDYTSELSNVPRWRLPSSLGDPGHAVTSGNVGDVDSEQLVAAFRLMTLVRRVYIRLNRPGETVPHLVNSAIPSPDIVALVVSHIPSLTDFKLAGSTSNIENSISADPDYSLWKLSHLRSISLDFNLWKPDLWYLFLSVLHRSPEMEELHVPSFVVYNADAVCALMKCRFPRLKRVYLSFSPYPFVYEDTFFFLEAHPTIETLQWSTFDPYTIPHAILPSLKHLVSCSSTTISMLLHNSPEASVSLESIEDVGLDSYLLPVFDRINPATFRRLSIHHLDRFVTLQTLAARFPTLTEIELPRRGPWDDNHRFFTQLKKALLRPWIEDLSMPHIDDVLELFPRAEVVKGVRCSGLSYGQIQEDPKVTRVLGALKARYPRLRRVNTWRLL